MIFTKARLMVVGAVAAGLAITAGSAQAATPATDQALTPAGVATCEFPRWISISDAASYEGTGAGSTTLTFTVTSTGCSHAASVSYPNLNTQDYSLTGGTLSWNHGDMTPRTIVVNVVRDNIDEPNESFGVPLSPVSGWAGISGQGTGTIYDDDGPKAKWNISDVTCSEGDPANGALKPCAFTVTRSKPVPQGAVFTLNFHTFDLTAVAGKDYDAPPNNVGWIQVFQFSNVGVGVVQLRTNDLCQTDRTLQVQLSAPSDGGVLADPSGIMTIDEDDMFCDV